MKTTCTYSAHPRLQICAQVTPEYPGLHSHEPFCLQTTDPWAEHWHTLSQNWPAVTKQRWKLYFINSNYCAIISVHWTFNFVSFVGAEIQEFKIPTNYLFSLVILCFIWNPRNQSKQNILKQKKPAILCHAPRCTDPS